MSRTYRRKDHVPEYVPYAWRYNDGFYKEKLEGKALSKALAMYHSDKLMTMEQVPKWYKVVFCRRPFRAREKSAIGKAIKYPAEDIVFPINKKNAKYYW